MGFKLGNRGWVRVPKDWLSKMDAIKRESGFQRKADATRKGHGARIAGRRSPRSQGGSLFGTWDLRPGVAPKGSPGVAQGYSEEETLRWRRGPLGHTETHGSPHAHARARPSTRTRAQMDPQCTHARCTRPGPGLPDEERDSAAERPPGSGGPLPALPPRGLAQQAVARAGAPRALPQQGQARPREREERPGGGSGEGCVPAARGPGGWAERGSGGGAAAPIKSPSSRA